MAVDYSWVGNMGQSPPVYTPPQQQQYPSYQQASAPRYRDPNGFFSDATTAPLMQSWQTRMDQLEKPGPGYGDISNIFSGFLKPDPRFDDALSRMFAVSSSAGATNPYTGGYAKAVNKRYDQLNADPFSTSDEAALKARFYDSAALSRDAAYDAVAQQMASRGFAPTSGVATQANELVNADWQKARAGATQSLLEYVANEAQRRKDLGVTIKGQLAGQGAQDAANANQWKGTQANILGNIAGALSQMRGQQMSAAGEIAGLRRQEYLDDMSRGEQLLQTSALPSSLEEQRMLEMAQMLGGQPDINSIFGNYLNMNQQQAYLDAMRNQQKSGLGSVFGNIGSKIIGNVIDRYI